MTRFRILAAVAALLLPAACTTTTDGAAAAVGGPVAGTPCNPAVASDVCGTSASGSSALHCDPNGNIWLSMLTCTGGTVCTAAPSGFLCATPPAGQTDVGAQTVDADATANPETIATDGAGLDADTLGGDAVVVTPDATQGDSTVGPSDLSRLPAPWSTAGCPYAYVAPAVSPGCTSAADKAWVAAADANATLGDNFGTIVSDCTLKQGCLAEGLQCSATEDQTTSKSICITDCIVKTCGALADADPASAKCAPLSKNCAWCYGRYSGECGFEKCLTDCAPAPNSQACSDCLKTNCDAPRDACKGGQ